MREQEDIIIEDVDGEIYGSEYQSNETYEMTGTFKNASRNGIPIKSPRSHGAKLKQLPQI